MMQRRNGQAMLIAILTLGGAILGATSIAGLLLLYQIRSTTDTENSAKAIFAADSGVNWALYAYFNSPEGNAPAQPTLAGGVTQNTTCYAADGTVLGACDDYDNAQATPPATTSYAIAEGLSNGARRAFWVGLATATGTVP
jgi:hypothetical protein